MAHVLLPCDLPIWNDIQRHLAPLKVAKDVEQLVQGMAKIYELCSISLEPEEGHKPKKDSAGSRFDELKVFLEERLPPEDRNIFFNDTLPNMVSQALCLRLVKPARGFFYSIKRENESFELDRCFVKSLLANAFFSTFPKRTPNTHPFLQNFAFCDFFQHLHRRSQQKKLKAFFRYFQKQETKEKGTVIFSRKVLPSSSLLTLPGWLCSDRPLVPLLVHHEGNIHEAEAGMCRIFPCTSLIGGDVLQAATSPESSLFFAFPELLCCLIFVEKLEDNEALLAAGVSPRGIHRHHRIAGHEVNMCFVDSLDFGSDTERQFEDRCLLRQLNKALAAFSQRLNRESDHIEYQRRQTPVGESSSSEQHSCASSRRASIHNQYQKEVDLTRRRNSQDSTNLSSRTSKKNSSYLPLIDAGDSSVENRPRTLSKESTGSVGEFPKLPGQTTTVPPPLECLRGSTSSKDSSTKSMKTASESSLELPPIAQSTQPTQRTADEEYYTADEESEQGCESVKKARKRSKRSTKNCDLSSLLKSTSGLVSEQAGFSSPSNLAKDKALAAKEGSRDSLSSALSASSGRTSSPSRRSVSYGFVLGGTGSDDDIDDFALEEDGDHSEHGPPIHERLEDFRKRICRRTRRHLSRKMRNSLRSSYSLGSSTSSDMEDISEEDVEDSYDQHFHHHHQVMRPASSEPSLSSQNDPIMDVPPFSPGTDTVVLSIGGRKVLISSGNGHLKAYSYDGVNPNLPVPFRAKFRTRRKRHLSDENMNMKTDSHKDDSYLDTRRRGSCSDSEEEQKAKDFSLSDLPFLPPVPQWMERKCVAMNLEQHVWRRSSISDKCPAVVGPSRDGDPQLRALVLWLAASMAELPALIFYTGHDPQLYELDTVYRRVLSQRWTVGDLACEVLRFCRNKLSSRRRNCAAFLFEQLLSSGAVSATSSSRSCSQYSLD